MERERELERSESYKYRVDRRNENGTWLLGYSFHFLNEAVAKVKKYQSMGMVVRIVEIKSVTTERVTFFDDELL